jgi:hypothetical protein
VRGDSLRDLYAKTLALVGLGLLGAIGAAVDYWPSGIQMPSVTTALSSAEGLSALPVTDVDVPFHPAAPLRRAVMASVTPTAPAPVPTAPEPIAVMTSQDLTLGAAVSLGTPPAPELVAPSALRALPTTQVALSRPSSFAPIGVDGLPAAPGARAAAADSGDDGGFFSGAGNVAKKAGSTIVNGTVKAGAPLVGIAKFIGNAFKKIR